MVTCSTVGNAAECAVLPESSEVVTVHLHNDCRARPSCPAKTARQVHVLLN